MSFLSGLFIALFYFAGAVLVVGTAMKIRQYMSVPAPLKIPVTPAPITKTGVVWRFTHEIVLFTSLFRATKWTWLFGWMFHCALLLAFFRHLRYGMSPDNIFFPLIHFEIVQTAGKYGGIFMLVGLGGLFARRIFVDRVRYISSPSDYLMLLLIMGIAATGLFMSFISHVDIVQLKLFMMGLIYLDWQELPANLVLIAHLAMVILLMIIFPMSKLIHAPGLFFSPTRNQVDNPREQRHISNWGAEFDARDGR